MRLKTLLVTCFALALAGSAVAQEKLYLKTQKEPLDCRITEIGPSEIRYQPSDAPQLTMVVERMDVEKIVFKSGRVQYFTDPLEDKNLYKKQKEWAAKVGLLSPAFGYTDFYLEKSVKPGRSVEFQTSIIGLGKNRAYYSNYTNYQTASLDQRGISIGAGYKVMRMPDYEQNHRKLVHILQGSYIKPALTLGAYQRNFVYLDYVGNYALTKKTVLTSYLSVSLGKQWVFDNTFCIDFYANLGLAVDNYRAQQARVIRDGNGYLNVDDDVMPYTNFGYTRFGKGNTGVGIGAGLKVGYLFNTKRNKEVKGLDKMRERIK